MTPEQMESFSSSVPDPFKAKFFLPNSTSELIRPWHCADLAFEYIKGKKLADDDLVLVSFSLGGVVAQWLISGHPELHVKKLIMVGSPVGGYKFVPPNNFFSNDFPPNLAIYVVAGNKSSDVWFLRDQNDGVVDLQSALDIPDQNLKDAEIVYANHSELVKLPEVQLYLSRWIDIEHVPAQNFVTNLNLSALPYNHESLTPPSANKLPN